MRIKEKYTGNGPLQLILVLVYDSCFRVYLYFKTALLHHELTSNTYMYLWLHRPHQTKVRFSWQENKTKVISRHCRLVITGFYVASAKSRCVQFSFYT